MALRSVARSGAGKVAENASVCLRGGSAVSSLSASSSTSSRTPLASSASDRRWPTSRPGVPHASWQPPMSAASERTGVPPMKAWQLSDGRCAPMPLHTSRTCTAISRVGVTMRACGPPPAFGWSDSSATTANTQVLPVPDLAWAMRSTPKRASGIAFAWIGEGRTKP
eukprot:scaffold111903_cov60-Phaeocystis_antarctica.AAC.2